MMFFETFADEWISVWMEHDIPTATMAAVSSQYVPRGEIPHPPVILKERLPTMFSVDTALDALHGLPMTDMGFFVPKESIRRDFSGDIHIHIPSGYYLTPDQYKFWKGWIEFTDNAHKERMQQVEPVKLLDDSKSYINLGKKNAHHR